ncbi:hypothetical protein QBC32DRAFT_214049 [Pseudoneurospora amorphoporcata]|uniref:Uncharacterized protein n=1 Tax=Pseudoneurospora amorphoporcata TaxID=241081 RepID=A0AAN6SFN8_9PEZI|nr:hypothetical protein QBC32DRAFT_214049 [Pseudoneurospora amorphoporcata]
MRSYLRSNSPKRAVWNPRHSQERDNEPPRAVPEGLDEARLDNITDQVLAFNDPKILLGSMANMIQIMREAAGGNGDAFQRIFEHVTHAITQSRHLDVFGVRNPAPPYSGLPTEGEATADLAVAVPEYTPPPPCYTRYPVSPPQPLRSRKRKRERQDDDGEEDNEERKHKAQSREENGK